MGESPIRRERATARAQTPPSGAPYNAPSRSRLGLPTSNWILNDPGAPPGFVASPDSASAPTRSAGDGDVRATFYAPAPADFGRARSAPPGRVFEPLAALVLAGEALPIASRRAEPPHSSIGFDPFTLARMPDSLRKPPLPSVRCRPMRARQSPRRVGLQHRPLVPRFPPWPQRRVPPHVSPPAWACSLAPDRALARTSVVRGSRGSADSQGTTSSLTLRQTLPTPSRIKEAPEPLRPGHP